METQEGCKANAPVCSDPSLIPSRRIILEKCRSGWQAFDENAPTIVGFGRTPAHALYALDQIAEPPLTPAPKSDILRTSQECDQRGLATRSDS
jgi:hypothetical protein